MTDRDLLREYVKRGSETAFRSLVERHVDLVFATANRQLNDAAAAQEVTQNVFIALARKAARLQGDNTLTGWLHKTTLLESRQWWRGEYRRQRREQNAIELGTTMKDEESLLTSMTSVLDEGLMELREPERQALMLRYFEEQNHLEIGKALGTGDDAARKRIEKALEKLTQFFRRRGYAVPAVATTAAALKAAAQTAPSGLSIIITKGAITAGSVGSVTGLGLLIGTFMGLTKTQVVVVCALVAAGPVTYEWHASAKAGREQTLLREEILQINKQLSDRQGHLDETQRKLQAAESNLKRLGGAIAEQRASALAARAAAATNLYSWSDDSDYVRLPKSIAGSLTLSESVQIPRPRGGYRREQDYVLGEDGSLAAPLTESLGLTQNEDAEVQTLFQNFMLSYQQQVQAHTYVTNVAPAEFGIGDRQSLSQVTMSFATEGQALKERLRDSITATLGKERADVVWEQVSGTFEGRYNNFGGEDLIKTAVLETNGDFKGEFRYWEGHRGSQAGSPWLPSRVTYVKEEQLPEGIRPFLPKLKPAAAKL